MKKKRLMMVFALSAMFAMNVNGQEEEAYVPSGSDAGVEAVYAAQEITIKPPVQKYNTTTPINAQEQIKQFIKKHNEKAKIKGKSLWNTGGYENDRIFQIGTVEFDVTNPSEEPTFLVDREMATKQAVMEAKIKIIESINSNMSASEKLTMPDSDINKKFEKQIAEAEKALNKMKSRLKRLQQYMDKADQEQLDGITWNVLCKEWLARVIKKMDKKFDTGEIEAKQKTRYEKSKAKYEEQVKLMAPIDKELEAMKKPAGKTQLNSTQQLASMSLYGATVITQAESWDYNEEAYQVSVLVCWSKTLHRAARGVATGEDYQLSNPKKSKGSVHDWLEKQDKTVMCGPRQFLDGEGNRWFLGITARALPKSSLARERARDIADMNAKSMAVFCIYSDLKSQKATSQMKKTSLVNDKDISQTAETMSKILSNEFKNKSIRGLSQLYSNTGIHPISGEKIYYTAWGINPTFAKQAIALEAKNNATTVQSNKYQSEEKGRKAGFEAEVKASENDKASYNKGYGEARKDVSGEVSKRENIREAKEQAKAKKNQGIYNTQRRIKKTPVKRQSQSGTFIGDVEVDDDF